MPYLSHASARKRLFPIFLCSIITGAALSVTTSLSAIFMTNKLSSNTVIILPDIGIILSAFSALLFLFLVKNIYSFYKINNELGEKSKELSKKTNTYLNAFTTLGFIIGFGGVSAIMAAEGILYLLKAEALLNDPILTIRGAVALSVGIFSLLIVLGIVCFEEPLFGCHENNKKSGFHSQSQINSKAPLEAEKSPKIAKSKKEWSTPLVNTSDTEGIFVQQARADGIIEATISAISNKVLESVNEESRKTTDSPMLILQTRLEAAQKVLLSNSLQPPAYSK